MPYFSPQSSPLPAPSACWAPTWATSLSLGAAKKERVFGPLTAAAYTSAVSSGLQLIPPNQAKSVQTAPCVSGGRAMRLTSRCPLLVQISNASRVPLLAGRSSSTSTASFLPDGEGMRAWTLAGISAGGTASGGRPGSGTW